MIEDDATYWPRRATARVAWEWWRSKRPIGYTPKQHLENPTVNCTSEAEITLAESVAEMVRSGAPQ